MMIQVTRRELLKGAAALGAAATAPGALTPARAQTTQKRELVVAQGGDISKFDPHFSTSSNDIRVSFNLFDNLVSRHPDGKLYPGLATEWKLHGQTQWTFRIRPGVKWHNADPFTAADAKWSLERTWDPKVGTRVSTVFTTIDRIEAPDPATLVVHTKKPDPLLPARLAFYGGQIVPQKYVEKAGNDEFNAKPIGTGPVRFVSWTKDDRLVLEANPDYWGGRIDVDRIVLRSIPETAPRIASLLKGEVDVITQLPPDQEERVMGNASTKVEGALYAGLYVLAVNGKRPPLDNPLVKQALSLAIDRQAIVKELWRGRGIIPNGPIAKGDNHFKGLWWSDPTSTLGDPDGMMWRLLSPGGPQDYWRHPRFDELGEAARFSVDEKFRGEAYREMTKIFLEHFPWVPVIQPYEDYGLQKYVEWTPNPNQQFEVRRFNLKLRRA